MFCFTHTLRWQLPGSSGLWKPFKTETLQKLQKCVMCFKQENKLRSYECNAAWLKPLLKQRVMVKKDLVTTGYSTGQITLLDGSCHGVYCTKILEVSRGSVEHNKTC